MLRFLPIALCLALAASGCARGAPSFGGEAPADAGCEGPACLESTPDAGIDAGSDTPRREPDASPDVPCTTQWFADVDGDGFGAVGSTPVTACEQPPGTAPTGGDCDDATPDVHPGANEVAADGVDSDCDGMELCYIDADGDGHRAGDATTASATLNCTDVGQAAATAPATDCDDTDPSVHGSASEICDGADNNCDGVADEGLDCPCDLVNYRGTRYLLCSLTRQWPESRSLCAQYGYRLVRLDSPGEDQWLREELRRTDEDPAWIGFNDIETEGTWVWDGGGPASYTGWRDGEPNNDDGGEHCGAYDVDGSETGWFDTECDRDFRFVCEALD